MANIIYDAAKIKVMGFLGDLAAYAGLDEEWVNEVWAEFLSHPKIYEEFVYYIEHHELLGKYQIQGYSILECYVWQRNNQVYRTDERGRFEPEGNEETVVLKAFRFMMEFEEHPAEYIKMLEDDLGRDKMR